ncbi:polar amino acid transport system permease protein [Paenibacillus sp. 1_12]|uniref:amino acid ABC transporter permease n=1 Tax=Paenibacillus sp. 1_12 TaxID=1566278 RepID=UPI0008E122FD|nr:amino acid ABC transporter permease [Paenibacillus sp. 1_12]SFM46212.1 polar amino acid transport system permease protein [Paenibacillus sp. 1_12]
MLLDLQKFLPILLQGALTTIEITIIALVIGILLGLFIGLGRISKNKLISSICRFYISVLRGTPLLVQLMYIYFALPEIGISLSPLEAAIVGLALNESAYMAENFRAGIQSVPKGQMEASKAIGMSYSLAMRRIILPQAVRNILPTIGNSAVLLLKSSSLAGVITVGELMHKGELLAASTFKNLEIFTMVGVLYWLLHYPLAALVNYMEKRGDYNNVSSKRH